MNRVARILCPSDGSESAERALQQAIRLARWYESQIIALHVIPSTMPLLGTHPHVANPLLVEPEATRERALQELEPGSVTETVLREASCPVLTVSHRQDTLVGAPFKRILCATDFSPSAGSALSHALRLAQQAPGPLILVNVREDLPVRQIRRRQPVEPGGSGGELMDEAWNRLRAAVPPTARDWCHTQEIVTRGRAHEEIVRIAQESEADVVVMGVDGRSALDRMMFGSTTHHVVRTASCPVLTVRGSVRELRRAATGTRRLQEVGGTA